VCIWSGLLQYLRPTLPGGVQVNLKDSPLPLARWVSLAIGLGAIGCGGAASSDLLGGDGSPTVLDGASDGGSPEDVFHPQDAMLTPDTSPVDVVVAKDTAPIDTGPIDTGPPPLPPVQCGTSTCPVPGSDCCINREADADTEPTFDCETPAHVDDCRMGGGQPVECDEGADCPTGQCCGTFNEDQTGYSIVECETACNEEQILFCDPESSADMTECMDMGGECQKSTFLPGLYVCNTGL
jgi:hypothetical protein